MAEHRPGIKLQVIPVCRELSVYFNHNTSGSSARSNVKSTDLVRSQFNTGHALPAGACLLLKRFGYLRCDRRCGREADEELGSVDQGVIKCLNKWKRVPILGNNTSRMYFNTRPGMGIQGDFERQLQFHRRAVLPAIQSHVAAQFSICFHLEISFVIRIKNSMPSGDRGERSSADGMDLMY